MDATFGARDGSVADDCTIGDAHLSGKNYPITETRSAGNTHL